jgi:hypothetical protein
MGGLIRTQHVCMIHIRTYVYIGGIAQAHKVLCVGARLGKGHAPRCHGDGVCVCVCVCVCVPVRVRQGVCVCV